MDSVCLQPWIPLCGVSSCCFCSWNTNHSCSQNGLLYVTLVILFSPVLLSLGMVITLQLLILRYVIIPLCFSYPISPNTFVNMLHIKSFSRLLLIWMSSGGVHLEDVTTGWPMSQWTWAIGGSLPSPCKPSLECAFCRLFPQPKPFERTMCCWDYLDSIPDWTLLKPHYRLLRLWQMGRSTHLQPPKTSLVCTFPCLLNLPPINLEWLASFFSPCNCLGASYRFHLKNSWVC